VSNRLGIYVDDVYRVVEDDSGMRISSDRAFLLFAHQVAQHFDELVVFGRAARSDEDADYVLPAGIRLVSLPHYANLRRLLQVGRSGIGTATAMWSGLVFVDTVWIFGPHPFGFLLIALAQLRRKRIVLGVRQDTFRYHQTRLQGRRWLPVLGMVWLADGLHRVLARRLPTAVVGRKIAERYGLERSTILPMTVSLVPERELADKPTIRELPGEVRLLTIGRLEVEKNPLLVVDVLAELERRQPERFSLTWIGRGTLEDEVRARAASLGVSERLTLRGYVPFGPELLELYRDADLFLHVSLTEGVPQVLVEALACGTPIVATAVGGVASALDNGKAGVLVPPGDAIALADAIESLIADTELRKHLLTYGRGLVRDLTIEAEGARVATFLAGGKVRQDSSSWTS
jgi:glycosyltransferase involved in cell wall biosynthesis